MAHRLSLLLAVLGACTPSTGAPQPESPPVEADRAPTADPTAPLDATSTVVKAICGSDCAGPFASLVVFRDADGAVARIRFDGDLEVCSHPPRIYFDAQGGQVLAIPNEPVVADSPEARELAADQAAQVEGLVEAESLRCP